MRVPAIVLLLGALLVGALILTEDTVAFEDRFIFFPSREIMSTPARVGVPFEEVRFGPDGRLHGWFVPGTAGPTFLWFHGNAGNISHRVAMMELIRRELGVSIFIFDYQGYGRSAGRASEPATHEDARAALTYLRSRPDVDQGRIVYFGKSLGAAVATRLATEDPPYRLIVQSAFTSVSEMARLHYPFLPIGRLLSTRFDTHERIGNVRAPVLIIHGDRDEIVPLDHAQLLYGAAAEPKRLFVVRGAGHNDVIDVGGRQYLDVLREFCGME
jgi:uncharacterized protein